MALTFSDILLFSIFLMNLDAFIEKKTVQVRKALEAFQANYDDAELILAQFDALVVQLKQMTPREVQEWDYADYEQGEEISEKLREIESAQESLQTTYRDIYSCSLVRKILVTFRHKAEIEKAQELARRTPGELKEMKSRHYLEVLAQRDALPILSSVSKSTFVPLSEDNYQSFDSPTQRQLVEKLVSALSDSSGNIVHVSIDDYRMEDLKHVYFCWIQVLKKRYLNSFNSGGYLMYSLPTIPL